MQMKEILHPGVIKSPVMCVVGGGVLRKHGTTLFIALRKCHYSQIRRQGGTGGSEAVTGLDSRLIGLAWESVCSTASGADCTEDVHGF